MCRINESRFEDQYFAQKLADYIDPDCWDCGEAWDKCICEPKEDPELFGGDKDE